MYRKAIVLITFLTIATLPQQVNAAPLPISESSNLWHRFQTGRFVVCLAENEGRVSAGKIAQKSGNDVFVSYRDQYRKFKSLLGQNHRKTMKLRSRMTAGKRLCLSEATGEEVPLLVGPDSHQFSALNLPTHEVLLYGANFDSETRIYSVSANGSYLKKPQRLTAETLSPELIQLSFTEPFTNTHRLIAWRKSGSQMFTSTEPLEIAFQAASDTAGECGDAVINAGETCDQNTEVCAVDGGYAGARMCNTGCDGFLSCETDERCGDNEVNGLEICDGTTRSCTTENSQAGEQNCNSSCSGYDECVATTPVEEPFAWYPSLDLAKIPWHTSAGSWGPQVPLETPGAPVTTRSVTVNSVSEFNSEAQVAGTQITIATGWDQSEFASIRASDVDVILPAGVTIGMIQLGAYPYTTPVSRVRIRGSSPGEHSGGLMGQFRDFALATDIIIDGIDINGASSFSGAETNQGLRVSSTRIAILNSRVIAAGFTWLGNGRHVVIANSNFFHGAASRASVGFAEGWGFRNSAGPVTIVDTRIEGTRYHNLRVHSQGNSAELIYITGSTFVANAESRTAWFWNNLGNGPWNGQGAILEDSDIYSYSAPGCAFAQEISVINDEYSRVRNNRFYSSGQSNFTQDYLDSAAAAGAGSPGDHDWSEGNSFLSFTSLPAWAGPGDPRDVPLPGGLTLISGESPCTSFGY